MNNNTIIIDPMISVANSIKAAYLEGNFYCTIELTDSIDVEKIIGLLKFLGYEVFTIKNDYKRDTLLISWGDPDLITDEVIIHSHKGRDMKEFGYTKLNKHIHIFAETAARKTTNVRIAKGCTATDKHLERDIANLRGVKIKAPKVRNENGEVIINPLTISDYKINIEDERFYHNALDAYKESLTINIYY